MIEQADQVLKCAYLACAGDGEVSEEEMSQLETLRGTVNKLIDMRQAVEYYQSSGDLEGALEIYPPGQPIEICYGEDGISLLGIVPCFYQEIHEQRSRLTNDHSVSELLKREASLIRDSYLQVVTCQACMLACSPGGVSEAERKAIFTMSQFWERDLYEGLSWLEDYVYPVLNGEAPIERKSMDRREVMFAIARASAHGDMEKAELLLKDLFGGELPDDLNEAELDSLFREKLQ